MEEMLKSEPIEPVAKVWTDRVRPFKEVMEVVGRARPFQ